MKLIDADELLKTIREQEQWNVPDFVYESIQKAPTVEAILVEWIKKYARHKASKGFYEIDCYWQFWEEDVLKMVADWEEEQASLFEKQITEECTSAERFADWEKENE